MMPYCSFKRAHEELEQCFESLESADIQDIKAAATLSEGRHIEPLIDLCKRVAAKYKQPERSFVPTCNAHCIKDTIDNGFCACWNEQMEPYNTTHE